MDKERIASVLRAVFENNVMKSMGGTMGAVNGFSPVDNAIDISAAQSEETWTGSSYAVAATMIFNVRMSLNFRHGQFRVI